jgi:hypothetical protein
MDQASKGAARVLSPPTLLLCSLPSALTQQLYSTIVSQALRKALRGSNLWINIAYASVMYG